MKGILLSSLISCSVLTTVSYGDTLVPANTLNDMTSPASAVGVVNIENGGRLKLTFPAGSVLSNDITNNGSIGDFSTNTSTLSGVISGAGEFYKAGTGTTIFSGNNTYTGMTYLSAGTLRAAASNVLSAQSPVYLDSAASFDLSNFQQSVGSVSGNGSVVLGTASLPSEAGLVKLGAGRLALGANSGMSGAATGGSVSVNGATIFSGGTLSRGGAGTFSGAVTVTAGNLSNSRNTLILGGTVDVGGGVMKLGNGAAPLGSSLVVNLVNGGEGDTFTLLTFGAAQTIALPTLSVADSGLVVFNDSSNGANIGSVFLRGPSFPLAVGNVINSQPPLNGLSRMPALCGGVTPTSNGCGVLITGNDNTNQIFSGVLSGNGSVIKVGTGYWNLTGANTYTGLTTVADGALLVNGSIPGDVFVWGGMLGGSGRIGGSVLNQSVVSPGNSPGTLTIAGDYAQSSTGYLLIQLASQAVYDKVVIGGQANLDGGVAIQLYNGFQPRKGDSFTILSAAGGINGYFSHLVYPSGTLLWYGLEYRPTSVILDVLQGSFAKDVPNLTPNQLAVGKALDHVVNSKRVSKLVDELDTLPLGEVPNALEKIVPTNLLSMFESSIASATVQADNLERRMEEIRDGSTGFSAGGLHLANSRGEKSGRGDGDGKQAIGKDGKELAPAPLSERWGYFINGSGEFVDMDSTAIARGTDFTTGGISTGADYRLGDHAAVGVTAGYSNSSTNNSGGQSSVKTDAGKLGLYGTVFDRGFFLNSALGGGLNSYDTKRETLGGNACGDTNGNDFNALLGTGYTYRKGGWSVGPIASMRYSWVGIDGFTERGSLAPLRFGDQSEDSLKSTVGMQAAYAFRLGKVTVKPEVRAQWQHEYLNENRSIGASFLPGGAFSVFGPNIGQDSLLLDAGVTVQLTPLVGIYGCYTGDLGRQNYSLNSVNGGIQVSF